MRLLVKHLGEPVDGLHLEGLIVDHEDPVLTAKDDDFVAILLEEVVHIDLDEERLQFGGWNLVLDRESVVPLSLKDEQGRLVLLLSDQSLTSDDCQQLLVLGLLKPDDLLRLTGLGLWQWELDFIDLNKRFAVKDE